MALPRFLQRWLERPPIAQIRRNHALEHATIHVLSQRFPQRSFAGYSDPRGFWLWADVSTEDVALAVLEALHRLQAGESHLAVHPGCGTNYLVMAALSAATAMGTLRLTRKIRSWWDRFSLLTSLLTIVLVLAQPLGHWLQAFVTTSPDLAAMQVVDVRAVPRGRGTLYRVETAWKPAAAPQA